MNETNTDVLWNGSGWELFDDLCKDNIGTSTAQESMEIAPFKPMQMPEEALIVISMSFCAAGEALLKHKVSP